MSCNISLDRTFSALQLSKSQLFINNLDEKYFFSRKKDQISLAPHI